MTPQELTELYFKAIENYKEGLLLSDSSSCFKVGSWTIQGEPFVHPSQVGHVQLTHLPCGSIVCQWCHNGFSWRGFCFRYRISCGKVLFKWKPIMLGVVRLLDDATYMFLCSFDLYFLFMLFMGNAYLHVCLCFLILSLHLI